MNHAFTRQFPKYLWILLLIFNLNNAFAQSGKVSVDFNNATPAEIIKNLESRTPYRFVYPENLDLTGAKVTLKKENVSIDEVLKELQAATNLNFRRTENNIAVNKKQTAKKPGKVTGKVVDATGLSLPGASIRVVETGLSAVSDIDGNYTLSLEPGVYTIEISFMSFQTQNITGVKVAENNITSLNVALIEDTQSLNEVVITQTYQKATASTEGMLLEQKKAAQMSDGISAEQISRTPDRDVGATLKRINGVTTVDDRFVVVRSMGERWNQAVMDGINLPSTDPVQQQFNFDIIPTSMVESVVVSKNATPDMYANFAGGHVEVRTKSIPKENFTFASVGSSHNSRSTFKDRLTKQQGSSDYLGYDDGTRSYPSNLQSIPLPGSEAESGPFVEQSKRFTKDNFSTYKTNTAPGSSFQFAVGRSYDLKDNNRWGFVGSLIFRNTQEKLDIEHSERGSLMHNSRYLSGPDGGYNTLEQFGFKNSGASYSYNSTLGGMFNAGIQFGNHKITLRNVYLHIYDSQLTQITGWNFYSDEVGEIVNGTDLPFTEEINYPVYQTFIQNKIEGEHLFGKLEVNWFLAYSSTDKDTKDVTFTRKQRRKSGDDVLLYIPLYNSDTNVFTRGNFTNEEKNYNAALNFKYPFNFSDTFLNEVKAGYYGTYKKASNQQVKTSLMVVGQGTDRADVYLPESQLLDGSHYGWGQFGWQKFSGFGNRYVGDVKIHSPFIMLDNKIGKLIRLVWGVRAESFVYTQIENQADDALGFDKLQPDEKVWQYLPSANLTVSPTSKTNLRAGYHKSVLRPQFSERLSVPYKDPVRNALILNYYGLVSTTVDNYDLKAEWFPSRGEILSVGVYRKKIKDPIEAITFIGGDGGSRSILNMNSHSANVRGIEMEVYKNLTFLGDDETLKDIYLYGNASFNKTKVTGYVNSNGTGPTYEANRPLYGQSPYTYNLGLDYIGNRFGFSIRHNATGDQYILVGFDYDGEEIRMPYSITDAQVSYRFLKDRNLEFKVGARNLFDSPIETYNNGNSYRAAIDGEYGRNPREAYGLVPQAGNKYDEGIDRKVFKAWTGRTINFTLNYTF